MSGFHVLDPAKLRRIGHQALRDGELQVLPAAFWRQYTQEEISYFCVTNGFYCIPTAELIEWLAARIEGRMTIEVGSGNGVLAKALKIPATDSFQQDNPEIARVYKQTGQATIKYGSNVEKLDYLQAMDKYKPEIVIGAWVTHRYNPNEHWREGNTWGLEERDIIRRADYINIGHTFVHRGKPLWDLASRLNPKFYIEYPDFLVGRALSEGRNYVAIWEKGNRHTQA